MYIHIEFPIKCFAASCIGICHQVIHQIQKSWIHNSKETHHSTGWIKQESIQTKRWKPRENLFEPMIENVTLWILNIVETNKVNR